jgi:hypothetical protein
MKRFDNIFCLELTPFSDASQEIDQLTSIAFPDGDETAIPEKKTFDGTK